MSDPREQFFDHVQQVSEYFGQNFSETDTRVYLIDPVLRLLDYVRPEDLRREVAVPATKESLDYELYANGKALAIVEAKAMRHPITDQAAAQSVQYAAVLGVRWCIITNGISWAIYNAHATGPLTDKKVVVVRLDGDERSTDAAWEVLSLFKRSSLSEASPLTKLLAERVIIDELSRADSNAVSALKRSIQVRFGERVSGQAVVEAIERWRQRSGTAASAYGRSVASIPDADPVVTVRRRAASTGKGNAARVAPRQVMGPGGGRVTLTDLIDAQLLPTDAALEMRVDGVTYAGRVRDGQIEVNGELHPTPSAAASALRGGMSQNGWIVWHFQNRPLSELRSMLVARSHVGASDGAE